jgi:DNA-binding MarR family transcriptional regulator
MAAHPPLLDQHLCFKLYSTSLKMTQLYKPMLSALNLTYPQYLVMVVLWEQEGLGIKDVAQRLQQDSGSITPLVKRLEAEGYLVRSRDPNDERNRVLTLTQAGQDLRAEGVRISQAIAHACNISQDDLMQMAGNLDRLNKTLSG